MHSNQARYQVTRPRAAVLTAFALALASCGADPVDTAGADGSTTITAISTTTPSTDTTVATAEEEAADDTTAEEPVGFVVDLDGDLDAQLFDALRADDTEALIALVDAGADLETTNRSKLTPFQLAVKAEKPEVAMALIDLGADLLVESPAAQQPTFYDALGSGYVDIVDAMIEAGEDVTQVEPNTKITPMMRAVESGDVDLIRTIAELGGDLDSTDTFDDGLYSWGFFFGHGVEVAEVLYELGVDPSFTNIYGLSVLDDAERRASPEVIEFIASLQP